MYVYMHFCPQVTIFCPFPWKVLLNEIKPWTITGLEEWYTDIGRAHNITISKINIAIHTVPLHGIQTVHVQLHKKNEIFANIKLAVFVNTVLC